MSEETASKTQRKKRMHELQELGVELVRLNEQQLASIDLPESLLEAVMHARQVSKFEARRRQLQYIGKLMRFIDAEPIRERIAAFKSVSTDETAQLHLIERWRERLLTEADALTEFLHAHPHADAPQLRVLIRNAQRERESGKPPKSFRALFHLVKETLPPRMQSER